MNTNTQTDRYLKKSENFESLFCLERVEKYVRAGTMLDIGIGDGRITNFLASFADKVVAVDSSSTIIARYIKSYGCSRNLEIVNSRFENSSIKCLFDEIILSNILEHVKNSVGFLRKAVRTLKKNGAVHVIVPNALSVHRIVGLNMGFLKNICTVT